MHILEDERTRLAEEFHGMFYALREGLNAIIEYTATNGGCVFY